MSEISDLLRALSELTYKLHILNLRQAAADYNYLLEWWESPAINNGHHLKPNPAGKNTIDEHSHNCPIPYYVQNGIADDCLSIAEATDALNGIKSILAELKSSTEDSDEITAIDAFDEYANDLITVLTGEAPEPPTPPGPEPSYLNAYFSNSGADNNDVTIGQNTYYYLWDSDGNAIIGDESKTYSVIGVYKSDGTKVDNDSRDFFLASLGQLLFYSYPIDDSSYLAYRLEYNAE